MSHHPLPPTIASELEAFLTDLSDRRGLRTNTINAYRSDLRTAASELTDPLDFITPAQIEAFLSSRTEQITTNNRRIASLRRFFHWAERQGYCQTNPMNLIEPKKEVEKLPRPIQSREDLLQLDRAIGAASQPYRLMLILLRETGMRSDEVIHLNVGDVCLEPGREGLRIRAPKNGHERTVVLTSDVTPKSIRGLRSWLKAMGRNPAPTRPLFCSSRGTRVAYDTLHYHWGQICRSAGLVDVVDGEEQPRYTIHQLRHTAATAFIQRYPEHIVSRMLGHRDPRSTRRYTELNESHVRAVLAEYRER